MSPRMSRFLLQGSAGLVGAAFLALAMWLYDLKPLVEAKTMKPIRSEGRIGQTIKNSKFSLKVDSVLVARSMASYSKQMRSDGIFLVVRAQVRSEHDPFSQGKVTLQSRDGHLYRSSPRIGLNDSFLERFEPLLWAPVAAVFELPASRLAGARFIFGEGGLPTTQLSAETGVDLGLTPSKAAELAAHAPENYRLEKS